MKNITDMTDEEFDNTDESELIESLQEDEAETETCPMCNGEAFPFGSLGRFQYFRCRYCGWTFSR